MKKLAIGFQNCYGIPKLDAEFIFDETGKINRAFGIYAPNGSMKTSFTRSFQKLAEGGLPEDERHNRPSICKVEVDGKEIDKEIIYVLRSEIDINTDSASITNILVDPSSKSLYDKLLIDLDSLKEKLIKSLQQTSKVKSKEVEGKILSDWGDKIFPICITKIKESPETEDLSLYPYENIFDEKALEILQGNDFSGKAKEFSERYHELFEQAGTIYAKGIFNPAKAETSFSALDKHGFFAGGHRVHMKGDELSIDKNELDLKVQAIHAKIDGDATLKKLRIDLAKNAQTQALNSLIEKLSSSELEFLLEKVKPENLTQFRKDLWTYYIQKSPITDAYLETYATNKIEIEKIEAEAAKAAPLWKKAVDLFNDRFVDMPFTLSVANQAQAVLGKETAILTFTFKSGEHTRQCTRNEAIKTLSQGEKRALYLLNFIFEVEDRILSGKETLFIIDDIADSFDYKNKHAIIQYLDDLCNVSFFHQIILTHNYDFFRTLRNTFVSYKNLLMANRNETSISLAGAKGVKNYFIGEWRDKVAENQFILCASIPFTRNLIEYTKPKNDPDYLLLTSLLHWKSDTEKITVGQYFKVFNAFFSSPHDDTSTQLFVDLIFTKSKEICDRDTHDALNLEDKVLLSIAVRLKAEIFLISQLRKIKGDPNYWCEEENQFRHLIKEYSNLAVDSKTKQSLEKVGITVSSNIHLNSFMYEPILDLTIEHLIVLYKEIVCLVSA